MKTSRCSAGSSSSAASSSSSSRRPRVPGLRPGLWRRQQFVKRRQPVLAVRIGRDRHRLERPAPEPVDDPIACHLKQPGTDLLDRPQHPDGFDQFAEHILQDVFGVARIRHAAPDKAPKPLALASDHLGDLPVLVSHHPIQGRGRIHDREDVRRGEILLGGKLGTKNHGDPHPRPLS